MGGYGEPASQVGAAGDPLLEVVDLGPIEAGVYDVGGQA
jgi:hypothetical protein